MLTFNARFYFQHIVAMCKPWRSFCVFILLFCFSVESKASHLVGSDITYKCTSTPGLFQVTLVIYRNCDGGVSLCSGSCGSSCTQTMTIAGAGGSCGTTSFGSFTLSLVNVRDVSANPDCPGTKNLCTNMNCVTAGTYTPAIERYQFVGYANVGPTSNIPSSCCNVRFAYSTSARNAQIKTGAANANFYVDAVVNRCLSVNPCNSSPELSNDPFTILCANEKFIFNNGSIDPDRDSLSYAFAPALTAYNTSVNYTSPYTYNKPMPFTGSVNDPFPSGIHCDPLTGDISFTPTSVSSTFYGVVVIEIKQWKTINGVPTVIGITRRDMQMVILSSCPPNNLPTIMTNPPNETNPTLPKTTWEVCAGEKLCFKVTAKDTDFLPPRISDTTFLTWDKAIANLGATFLPTYTLANRRKPAPIGGPREDEYQFCWTPSESMVSANPYYFSVSAKDNHCPNTGRTTRGFSVKVLGKANLSTKIVLDKCGKATVSYVNNNPAITPVSTIWQVSSVPGDFGMSNNPYTFTNRVTLPQLQFTKGGKYLVILQANSLGPIGSYCTKIFYDTIKIDTFVRPIVRDTTNCEGGSVSISASADKGKAPYTFKWYDDLVQANSGVPPLNASPYTSASLTVSPNVTRYYTLKVTDSDGCFSYDSLKVSIKILPVGSLPDSSRICYGDTFTLDPGNNGGNVKRYSWNTGDTSQVIKKTVSGKYIVTLTDMFNCVLKDSIQLYVNNQIIPNAGSDTIICIGDTVKLEGAGGQLYQWRDLTNGNIILAKGYKSQVSVSPSNISVPSLYELSVFSSSPDTVSRYKECSVVDTVSVAVKPVPVPMVKDTLSCFGNSITIGASAISGKAPYTYKWYNDVAQAKLNALPLNAPNYSSSNLNVSPISTGYFTVKVTDLDGCSSFDSLKVTVKELPKGDLPDSSRICYGDTLTLDPGNNGGKIKWYNWSTGDTTQIIQRNSSGKYIVTLTDIFNCVQNDTTQLYINNPIIPDAGKDTLVCFGDSVTLVGSGGQSYQWRELSSGNIVSAKGYNTNVKVCPLDLTALNLYEVKVFSSFPDTLLKYKECSVTDTVAITVKPYPILTRPKVTPVCKSSTVVTLPGFRTDQGGVGGQGTWSYDNNPAAIINLGTQVQVSALQNNPQSDTTGWFDNWIHYKYKAPQSFGGCTTYDSAVVRIYGTPKVNAGPKLLWCETAGAYKITYANQKQSPSGGSSGDGEEWIGPGITTTVSGLNVKKFEFNPKGNGVQKLPAINIIKYQYTLTYNKASADEISCVNADTVQFNVVEVPIIEAGNDLIICKNEPIFRLDTRTGANMKTITGSLFYGNPKWVAASGSLNNAIVNDSQDFNAMSNAIVFANNTTNSDYKLYYEDRSLGCVLKDSINIKVARVPKVDLRYDTPKKDSILVCQKSGNVYFRPFASNPFGVMGSNQLQDNFDIGGSSSFSKNTEFAANTARCVFNSETDNVGMHYLLMKYTDKTVETINGCTSVDTNIIYVQPPPSIQIASINAICGYDSSVALDLASMPNDTFDFVWRTSGNGKFSNDTLPAIYKIGSTDIQNGQVIISAVTRKKTHGIFAQKLFNGDQCDTVKSSTILTINQVPKADVLPLNTENCVPFTSQFALTSAKVPGAKYSWIWEDEPTIEDTDNDSVTIRTIEHYQPTSNGTHRVQLKVVSNTTPSCENKSDWMLVKAHAVPEADFTFEQIPTDDAHPFPLFNFTNQSTVIDGSVMSYVWNMGPDFNKSVNRYRTETHPLNVEFENDTAAKDVKLITTTPFGCVDTVDKKFRMKPEITVFIPTAFRPSSTIECADGDPDCNTVFRVVVNGQVSIETFVYNRWGQMVWTSTDPNGRWNGKVLNVGEHCPQDVYVYQVTATSYSGKTYHYSGSVTLLR